MSVLGKKWVVKNNDFNKSTFEKVLGNRTGIDLNMEEKLHDPFLFDEIEAALARIKEAVEKEERIIVFGDYDVDGITGTAILAQALKKIGAKVSYRLPHRVEDGYGLTAKFIKDFEENKVSLVITVDCGISCTDVVEKMKEKGIDAIITDHHTIPVKKPNAVAILHPKLEGSSYPYPELTGSGVAFKLAHAIIKRFSPDEDIDDYVDLASLGTIADLGPLTGENRTIVKMGLKRLKKTKWTGLRKIMEIAAIDFNKDMDTTTVGFQIAPRINAAGRIGDPYLALSLIMQDEKSEKTQALGDQLEKINGERKIMMKDAFEEAEKRVVDAGKVPPIIIIEDKGWHVGIVGLVAGRLAEKYGRPAIIMQDFGEMFVASARSPEHFNVIKAITKFGDYLVSFGGHAQAAGFNIEKKNLAAFKKDITKHAGKELKDVDPKPILEIDCELNTEEMNFALIKELEQLKPFGIENTKPTFLLKNIEPLFVGQVGKEGSHLKFSVRTAKDEVRVIAFRMGEHVDKMRKHRKIDVVCHLERNHWNNKDYVQLQALDFEKSQQ